MQAQRSWSDADAHEAATAFGRLCDRLVHGMPRSGDVSEWARLTLNVPASVLDEEDDTIDCDALVARYSAFWEALAQKPRVAEIMTGQRWPPSVTDVAALFDSAAIPGGIVDVGQGDPMLDLPASLDRRLRRRDLLQTRGPGTVDPAFPDPLPRWKHVLFPDIHDNNDADDHSGAALHCTDGDRQDSGRDRHSLLSQNQHILRGPTSMPHGRECRDAYFVVITPPSPEPDDEGDGYDMSVDLYQVVGGDSNAYPIAVGIVEWDETNNWMPVGRGDVFNSDRAEAVVGESASLLPAFLRRLARNLGAFDPLVNVATSGMASTNVHTITRNTEADCDVDCAPGWVAGADQVRGALIEIGSIEGLPEAIAAYEPGLRAPVYATWMDPNQLRLAVSLFAGQRAAKTARAIADADAARSLEGAAAAIYRGPAFAGLLPEGVAHRLAFHRWVRGCAGARDRPIYEEALWHWPEHSGDDVSIRLDNEPEAPVDPRRASCGADAAADILAAAEFLGIAPSAAETQRPRLLCATLARDAIRAGAWAAFGVRPLEPENLAPYADYAELAAQRGPWRRACMGTATLQDMAELAASARDAGLTLEDEDLVSPGRLCAKLALFMAT